MVHIRCRPLMTTTSTGGSSRWTACAPAGPRHRRTFALACSPARLPLPSYLRSDGAEMVPADLLDLADDAGGVDRLPDWFTRHWPTAEEGAEEWDAYLSGGYVCLRCVTPANIQRKTALVAAIEQALSRPQPELVSWLEQLHADVDELDALEPPFAPDYDRLRFGGPSSRSRCIDDVRDRFPRPSPGSRPPTAQSK